MKFKDESIWKKGLANNQDSYGGGVYTYAERWANMMEAKIEKGEKLEDCAKQLSHDADKEGITGFMYGAAVQILSAAWIHGEELRKWHNLDMQIGNEGEKANEKGIVLNPAIMTIGNDD